MSTKFGSISRSFRQASGAEAGQILVLFSLSLVVFFGLVAMSVDVGRLVVERTSEQNAADAASLAAIAVLADGGSHDAAVAEALSYAAQNGYTSGVAVNHPPLSGNSTGSTTAVEVVIAQAVPKIFLQVVYPGDWNTTARSVSTLMSTQQGFGVITLDPTQCESLHMNSNANLTVTGGGIFINSSCAATAFVMESNANASGSSINVVGGFEGKGNYHTNPDPPTTGATPQADPFASVPTPPIGVGSDETPASCEFATNAHYDFYPGVYNCQMKFNSNVTATFHAGDYTFYGGMQLDSNADLVFERGIYVMAGGGLQMNSNTVISDPSSGPTGVLIYNTCNGSCGASGPIQLNSNAQLSVSPYGDPYENIVIWQDRDSNTPLQFNSNSLTATGAMYAAAADVQYNSNANVPLQFVVANVQMNSNAQIVVDVTGMSTVGVISFGLSE